MARYLPPKSILFRQAHAITKIVIQTGDSYSATFALVLKAIAAGDIAIGTADTAKNGKSFVEFAYDKRPKAGAALFHAFVNRRGVAAARFLATVTAERFGSKYYGENDWMIRAYAA